MSNMLGYHLLPCFRLALFAFLLIRSTEAGQHDEEWAEYKARHGQVQEELMELLQSNTKSLVEAVDEDKLVDPPLAQLRSQDPNWDDGETGEEALGLQECPGGLIETEVVILGAGLAGLMAGGFLQHNERRSYEIIEADDRVGGRFRSFVSDFTLEDGTPITLEEGGNWMYGKGADAGIQPLYALFQRFGASYQDQDFFDRVMYRMDGSQVGQQNVDNGADRLNRKIENCPDYYGEEWFAEYLSDTGTFSEDMDVLTMLAECNWEPDSLIKDSSLHFLEAIEWGMPAELIGKATFPEDSFFDFGLDYWFPNDPSGSTAMLEQFIQEDLDDSRLHLNTKATYVRHTEEQDARVVTRKKLPNGDVCKQVFKAQYVISTLPMNVMKHNQATLFNPPLQIDDHPIDQNWIEKVWFQFPKDTPPFWPTDKQHILLATDNTGGAANWFFNYDHPTLYNGQSHLLMTFVGVAQLAQLPNQKLTKATAESHVLAALKELPGYVPPEKIHITGWRENPLAKGAWENWKLGSTYEAFEEATRPQGRLHLAGAGHCSRWWGFTWGAMVSGIKQARYVHRRLRGIDVEEAEPYSPCEDRNTIKENQWENWYRLYPFHIPKSS